MYKKLLPVLGLFFMLAGVNAQSDLLHSSVQSNDTEKPCKEMLALFIEDGKLTKEEIEKLEESRCLECVYGKRGCKELYSQFLSDGVIDEQEIITLKEKGCLFCEEGETEDVEDTWAEVNDTWTTERSCKEMLALFMEDGKLTEEEVKKLMELRCLECIYKVEWCKRLFYQFLSDGVIDEQEIITLNEKGCLFCEENDNVSSNVDLPEPSNECEKYIINYFNDGVLTVWEFLSLKKMWCLCKLSFDRLQEILMKRSKKNNVSVSNRSVAVWKAESNYLKNDTKSERMRFGSLKMHVLPFEKVYLVKKKLSKLSEKKRKLIKSKLLKIIPVLEKKDPKKALIAKDVLTILETMD